MGEHDDFYKIFCQPQFNKLFDKIDDIHGMLKGKNGNPGICDDLRELTKIQQVKKEKNSWLVKTFIAAVIVQLIFIARELMLLIINK